MSATTKTMSFSEMMNNIFNSYVPIVKNTYPLLFIVFIISLGSPYTFWGNLLFSFANLFLYSFYILKVDSILTANHKTFSLAEFAKRFVLFILMSNVVMLVLFVLMFALFFISYPIEHLIFNIPMSEDSEGLAFLGMLIGIIIGVLVSVYFFFCPFTFWIEKKSVFQSIGASCRLVKGKWFFSTLSLTWFALIFFIPYCMILSVIFELGMSPNGNSQSLLSLICSGVLTVIYYPIFVAAPLYLYYNLKSRSKS